MKGIIRNLNDPLKNSFWTQFTARWRYCLNV